MSRPFRSALAAPNILTPPDSDGATSDKGVTTQRRRSTKLAEEDPKEENGFESGTKSRQRLAKHLEPFKFSGNNKPNVVDIPDSPPATGMVIAMSSSPTHQDEPSSRSSRALRSPSPSDLTEVPETPPVNRTKALLPMSKDNHADIVKAITLTDDEEDSHTQSQRRVNQLRKFQKPVKLGNQSEEDEDCVITASGNLKKNKERSNKARTTSGQPQQTSRTQASESEQDDDDGWHVKKQGKPQKPVQRKRSAKKPEQKQNRRKKSETSDDEDFNDSSKANNRAKASTTSRRRRSQTIKDDDDDEDDEEEEEEEEEEDYDSEDDDMLMRHHKKRPTRSSSRLKNKNNDDSEEDDDDVEYLQQRKRIGEQKRPATSKASKPMRKRLAESDSDDGSQRKRVFKKRVVQDSDDDLPPMSTMLKGSDQDQMSLLNDRVKSLSSAFPHVDREHLRNLLLENDLDVERVGALVTGDEDNQPKAKRARTQVDSNDDESQEAEVVEEDVVEEVVDEAEKNMRRRVVEFFSESNFDTLAALSSKPTAATIINLRPFEDYHDLVRLFKSRNETELMSVLAKYTSSLREISVVDDVMEQCEGVSALLWQALGELNQAEPTSFRSASDDTAPLIELSPKKSSADFILQQPSNITPGLHLKHYQIAGLNWLNLLRQQQLGGILADEMGLGKTAQVIALLAHLLLQGVDGPYLIVVPSSTLDNWKREMQLWCPSLVVWTYHGSQKERNDLRNNISFAMNGAAADDNDADADDDDDNNHDGDVSGDDDYDNDSDDDRSDVDEKNSKPTKGSSSSSFGTMFKSGKADSPINLESSSLDAEPSKDSSSTKDQQKGSKLPFHVLLTTYGIAGGSKEDREFFRRFKFEYLILDEGHFVKNFASQRYAKLMRVRAKFRLLMTGTPLQNDLGELMSLLTFIMPKLFWSDSQELQRLFNAKTAGTATILADRVKRAKRLMAPFVLRRLKSQVLHQLPSKTVFVEKCALMPEQQQAYDQLMLDSKEKYNANKGTRGKKSLSHTLAYLRQLANHLCLHRWFYNDEKLTRMSKAILKDARYYDASADAVFEDMSIMSDFELSRLCESSPPLKSFAMNPSRLMISGKIQFLRKLLPELKQQHHRVLLFSQFKLVLDVLEPVLKMLKFTFIRLDGDTPITERQALIDRFNREDSIFIFLLSTRAGGFGINLTSADVVIMHDMDFNPHTDKQAEDRCHRVGQTRDVRVYKLVAKGTIEEQILECAERKLQLDKDVTNPDAATEKTSNAMLDFLRKQLER